jgi:hypothetical protein
MEGIAGSAAACDPSALFPLFEDGSERVAKVTALDYSELADADNVSDRRPPPTLCAPVMNTTCHQDPKT